MNTTTPTILEACECADPAHIGFHVCERCDTVTANTYDDNEFTAERVCDECLSLVEWIAEHRTVDCDPSVCDRNHEEDDAQDYDDWLTHMRD